MNERRLSSHRKTPTLILHSSSFSNFSTMFKLPKDCKISLEGCFLESFRDNCVELRNTKVLKMSNTTVKNSEMSGVVLKWDRTSVEAHKGRAVMFADCQILNNRMSGIEIY